MNRLFVTTLRFGAALSGSPALAQAIVQSEGELSSITMCSYTCERTKNGTACKEDTAISLVNSSAEFEQQGSAGTTVLYFDGAGNLVGFDNPDLALHDVDVINICVSLDRLDGGAPRSGLIYVVESAFNVVNATQTRHVGIMPRTKVELSEGLVLSSSENECREMPRDVISGGELFAKFQNERPQDLRLVGMSGTVE